MEKNQQRVHFSREKWRKFLMVMRLKIIVMLCCVQSISANVTYSQNQTMDISFNNEMLSNVLDYLTAQTGYQFFYQKDVIPVTERVSVDMKDAALEEILDKILKGRGYTYEIIGKTVAVRQAGKSSAQQPATPYSEGRVVDGSGNPLAGVNIIVEGRNRGVVTDVNGRFRIQAAENEILTFSFLGRKPVSILASDRAKLSRVVLQEDSTNIGQVSVIAYGEQATRELTGSIESIKAEDLRDLPSHSLANLLQGKAAGVSVINSSGAPGGGGSTITIRGFSSLSVREEGRRLSEPLWVIDGVPVPSLASDLDQSGWLLDGTGTGPVADLDPNFIESIEILKDAAAASIYGSRAANGVILVTTKRGKSGKTSVSVNYSESWNFNGKTPEITGGAMERRFRDMQLKNYVQGYRVTNPNGSYSYVNPSNHMEALKGGAYDLYWNKGQGLDVPTVQDSLNSFYNNSTDWFDEFVQVGRVRQANLQVSGGSSESLYNIGLGYFNEKGIMIGSDFTRVNLIGNYTSRPFENLLVDNRMSMSFTDRSKNRQSYVGMDLFDINPYRVSSLLPAGDSPVFAQAMENMKDVKEKNYDYKLRNNLMISYNILDNLKISSSLGIDFWQNMSDYFRPSYVDATNNRSYVSNTVGRSLMILNENVVTYDFNRNNHRFNAVVGQSSQWDQIDRIIGAATGGPSDYIHYVVGFPDLHNNYNEEDGSTTITAAQAFGSSHQKKTLVSWFGRINYVFKNRYLFSLSIRRDGSSTFGENNRWGNFPSFSAGWIFSDEPFLKDSHWLSFGKIRASYGKSGLHFSQPYLALGVYQADSQKQFLSQSGLTPVWEDGLYNPSLTWEETDQYDVGLDLELFDRRVKLTMDYYYRYTDGLLARVSLPGAGSYNPYQMQWRNAYAISNQGLEFRIDADIISKPEFTWEFSFNIARNWNRFEGSEDKRDFATSSSNYNIVGKPMNQIYVYRTDGIYQSDTDVPAYDYIRARYIYSLSGNSYTNMYRAGDPIYYDVNQDGQITSADKVYGGSPLPEFTGGFTNQFRYKNFDLNVLFTYLVGRTVLNTSLGTSFQLNITDASNKESVHALHPILTDLRDYDFWSPANTSGDYPMIQADPGRLVFSNLSSRYLKSVNYLKLKSVVLGYNIPQPFRNSKVSFRIFISGENLWTLTNYKGRDPEAIDIVTGIDSSETYPLSTRITAGFTMNF